MQKPQKTFKIIRFWKFWSKKDISLIKSTLLAYNDILNQTSFLSYTSNPGSDIDRFKMSFFCRCI